MGYYLAREAEITQTISELEDQLYAATEIINFNKIISRLTATLAQLPDSPPEIKKALISSLIERLDIAGGKVIHLTPRPWAQPFF